MCSIFTTIEPHEELYNILMLGSHAQRFRITGLGTFKISPGDCNVQPRWRTAGQKTFHADGCLSFVSGFIQRDLIGSTED